MAIGAKRVRVQVPTPIALLKAKIANVADIKQDGRQDARHVVILVQLMPALLADLVSATIQGRVAERDLVDRPEFLLASRCGPRSGRQTRGRHRGQSIHGR